MIKITFEVNLETLRNLYWLMSNTKTMIDEMKKFPGEKQRFNIGNFISSQASNMKPLEELYSEIEAIVEK